MKGTGLVWCCPKGVTNTLSQFRMVAHIKWRITYDNINYHRSGDVDGLIYEVITPEGFTCSFTPVSQALHVHKIKRDVIEKSLVLTLLTIKLSS